MCDFKKALIGKKYLLQKCTCDERIKLMGFREGEQVTLLRECPFGGTVMVDTRLGKFCIRIQEIQAELKEVT